MFYIRKTYGLLFVNQIVIITSNTEFGIIGNISKKRYKTRIAFEKYSGMALVNKLLHLLCTKSQSSFFIIKNIGKVVKSNVSTVLRRF